MSLISQRDRQLVIDALESYLQEPKLMNNYSTSEVYALINWIKLEHYKHEN